MTATLPSSPQDEILKNFRRHCRLFYQRSLSIHDPTFHPCQLQDQQQLSKKDSNTNGNPTGTPAGTKGAHEESKIILDALEHHIVNAHFENITEEFLEFLTSESVQPHLERLKACGLLPSATLLQPSSTQPKLLSSSSSSLSLPIISTASKEKSYSCKETTVETHEPSKCGNYKNMHTAMSHEVLMKYVEIRNEERRYAHEKQMNQRSIYLKQLIKDINKTNDPEDNFDSEKSVKEQHDIQNKHIVTSQLFLKNTKRQIQRFVSNYTHNIGTHSFLAGLRALMELQLKHDENIILWTFHGSTLSEVNVNSDATQEHSTTSWNKKVDGGHYIKDAIEMMKDFMRFHENDTDAYEKGCGQKHETILSFSIHNSMSNNFLGQLRSVLPKRHDLHTKPAGKLTVLDKDIFGVRKNPKGDQDEDYWTSWMMLIPWSSSGLHCDIL
mmetsp:Transcript_4661/g.8937  ORF Transcript_4661/g.8937 Transcript_4661/m.8937 type:complete len:440 (-) Transcript_4661:185-1504(-)